MTCQYHLWATDRNCSEFAEVMGELKLCRAHSACIDADIATTDVLRRATDDREPKKEYGWPR